MSARSKLQPRRQTGLFAITVLTLGMLLGSPAHSAPAATGTHPCSSADLRIAAGPAGAWHGQATQEVLLTNTGADACYLPGFPSVQLLPAGEAPQTVGPSEAAPQLADMRIDLAPGEQATMLLGTPGMCEAANKPQRKVSKRLQVALPGSGVKALDGVYIDTLCGRATVMKFHLVQNDAPAARSLASPLGQLTGSLSAPTEASRGSILHYTVTLSNPTANPVSLAACPTYTQSLYADGKEAVSTLRLNCAAAGAQIAAKSSVSFGMQVQVPAELAAGNAKLSWKLQDGPALGKMIDVR